MDLIETPKGWVEVTPAACPACGERWGRGGCMVSWHPCGCLGGPGHRTWQCNDCDTVTYDPPHTPGSWEGIAAIPIERTTGRTAKG